MPLIRSLFLHLFFVSAVSVALFSGCVRTYYRNVDGVNASIAVSLPDEDYIKLQVVEYISGNKTIVKEPAKIKHNFKTYATNEYLWGMIRINERRENDITVTPTNAMPVSVH